MKRLLATLLFLGCGGAGRSPDPAPPAAEKQEESVAPIEGRPACGYALYHLKMVNAGPHQQDHAAFGIAAAADQEGQSAFEAGDGKAAARHFLDCARAFREVPDDHFQRDTARENAEACYRNAYYSFATAGAFESEGRALFETARGEDPRMATLLGELLAGHPDCR